MHRICWLPRWTALCWLAGLSLPGAVVTNAAQAACASTPAAAAASLTGKSTVPSVTDGDEGFRVKSMRWDPVLRQQWAQIVSCAHPGWPAVQLLVHGMHVDALSSLEAHQSSAESLLPSVPVMRAGDVVQLWGQEDDLRIEVAAIAEQNGVLGKTVRVRLMQRKTLGQQIEEQFLGVVRGPHDVEMQQ